MSPPSSDPTTMTLADARDAIAAKKLSSRELTAAFVTAIEKARPLNAFITEAGEKALAMADASDKRIAAGEAGALEGVPHAIKDCSAPRAPSTAAGSKILGGFVPTYRSTEATQLWRDGAVMLGKANWTNSPWRSSGRPTPIGPVFEPVAPAKRVQSPAGPGRLVGRIVSGGRRGSGARRDRNQLQAVRFASRRQPPGGSWE